MPNGWASMQANFHELNLSCRLSQQYRTSCLAHSSGSDPFFYQPCYSFFSRFSSIPCESDISGSRVSLFISIRFIFYFPTTTKSKNKRLIVFFFLLPIHFFSEFILLTNTATLNGDYAERFLGPTASRSTASYSRLSRYIHNPLWNSACVQTIPIDCHHLQPV